MNIVIAGAGEVGRHSAEVLAGEGHQITVIDTDRGVSVTVAYTDDDIQASHGSGNVVAYPVCTDP